MQKSLFKKLVFLAVIFCVVFSNALVLAEETSAAAPASQAADETENLTLPAVLPDIASSVEKMKRISTVAAENARKQKEQVQKINERLGKATKGIPSQAEVDAARAGKEARDLAMARWEAVEVDEIQ